jgi:hypothetical protein
MTSNFGPPSIATPVPLRLPDFIYHYANQSGLLGILENRELWATKIHYLNDSTEFSYIFKMVDDLLAMEERRASNSERNKVATTLLSFAVANRNVNICVACFCANGDLLSQWRGYASGGYGYSIGFNAGKLTTFSEKVNFTLGPCIYDKATQEDIVRQVCEYYLNSNNINTLSLMQQFGAAIIKHGSFFKDPSFVDEEEWRLISESISARELDFRAGKSMIIPYCKIMKFHGPSDDTPIDHVIVGPCPHMDLAIQSVVMLLIREKIGKQSFSPPGVMPTVKGSIIPYRDW